MSRPEANFAPAPRRAAAHLPPSGAQVGPHPSPLVVPPSSHSSRPPVTTQASPPAQTSEGTHGSPLAAHRPVVCKNPSPQAACVQSAKQLSSLAWFPSSQASAPVTTPFGTPPSQAAKGTRRRRNYHCKDEYGSGQSSLAWRHGQSDPPLSFVAHLRSKTGPGESSQEPQEEQHIPVGTVAAIRNSTGRRGGTAKACGGHRMNSHRRHPRRGAPFDHLTYHATRRT